MKAPKIINVEYIKDYTFLLTFTTGEKKRVDLEDFVLGNMHNKNIYKLKNKSLFSKVKISEGHLMWGNCVDIAAEDLYDDCFHIRYALI